MAILLTLTVPLLLGPATVARRLTERPIIQPDMLPGRDGENLNGPSLIRAPDWLPGRLGRYYLYFAHHGGKYIRLAHADRLTGPWTIHEPGTLRLEQAPGCTGHIASPDVHVEEATRSLRMYFHGPARGGGGQLSFLAESTDGLTWTASAEPLGPFYFRCFAWDDAWFALAKGGLLLRSPDGRQPFVASHPVLPGRAAIVGDGNDPGPRHVAVHRSGERLDIYYSSIGDAPERILRRSLSLAGDHRAWRAGEVTEVLRPETVEEGADLPIRPSLSGAAKGREHALRDPAIFVDVDDRVYLVYSVAGESGLAIAEVVG